MISIHEVTTCMVPKKAVHTDWVSTGLIPSGPVPTGPFSTAWVLTGPVLTYVFLTYPISIYAFLMQVSFTYAVPTDHVLTYTIPTYAVLNYITSSYLFPLLGTKSQLTRLTRCDNQRGCGWAKTHDLSFCFLCQGAAQCKGQLGILFQEKRGSVNLSTQLYV